MVYVLKQDRIIGERHFEDASRDSIDAFRGCHPVDIEVSRCSRRIHEYADLVGPSRIRGIVVWLVGGGVHVRRSPRVA